MNSVERIKLLTQKLGRQTAVAQFNSATESEAERLGHALGDMADSFDRYLSDLLPKLMEAPDDKVLECLEDIGEELRHIVYHMRDAKFLAVYVSEMPAADEDRT